MDAIPFQLSSPHALVEELLRRKARRLNVAAEKVPTRPTPAAFSIALSRQAGTRAGEIARAIGAKLGWPVFDRELLERVAEDMGLRASLLKEVDEKQVSWIQETLESLGGGPTLSGAGYAKHLAATMLSLAAHGECVIVGRGSAQVLPAATTLRVRLIGHAKDRAQIISERMKIGIEEAQRRIQEIDSERKRFVENYFHKDPLDPHSYDVILNATRFSVDHAATLIVEALASISRPTSS